MAEAAPPAFEPERGRPEAQDAEPELEDFCQREIGILVEQGNFERARVLLARGAASRPDDAGLYLDAIRVERSAAPGGRAWEAWASRAFEQQAPIAEALLRLVPEKALAAYLIEQRVGWAALGGQRSAPAARDLLRLRLEPLTVRDPQAALRALEEPLLVRSARTDFALRELALAVLAAAVFADEARVRALLPEYEAAAAQAEPAQGDSFGRAALHEALRLQPAFARAAARAPCPPALERLLRSGPFLSYATRGGLREELRLDLRARPREYERAIDGMARASAGLLAFVERAIGELGRPLEGAAMAPGQIPADDRLVSLERSLGESGRELRRGTAARLWLASLGVLLLGPAALLAIAGAGRIWPSAALPLLLLPIRHAVDRLGYRQSLRPRLVRVVVEQRRSLGELAHALQHSSLPRRRALATLAERDATLALLAALARADG